MKLPPPQESYHNPDGGGWRKETKLPPPQESYPSPAVALVVEGGGKRWRFLLLKSHTTALPWPYGHTTALVVERWRKMTTTTTLPRPPKEALTGGGRVSEKLQLKSKLKSRI